MPTFGCTQCHHRFSEPGYCPYDGSPLSLRAAEDAVTVQGDSLSGPATPPHAPADSSAYAHLVGQVLEGRYRIERKIGEGGMGVVFAARHVVIERPLAIKVLRREVASDQDATKRFVQEAKAASRIGHPHIIDVTDFGTTPDGMTYQVMEFVDGATLAHALKGAAPLPLARILAITTQIAQAIGAAHAKGIVHRDLKPENVFLVHHDARRDFVKIVDFGIAKVAPLPNDTSAGPRLTRAGAVFGTPEYMAPEQAAGRSDTDGRVDIYALGTILYEMMTGRVPHRSESTVRTLAMQMLDPIEPPSQLRPDLEIDPELEAVVMRALAKNRDQRYQSMAEVFEALRAVAELRGISLLQPMAGGVLAPHPAAGDGADPLEPATLRDHRASAASSPPPLSQPPPPLAAATGLDYHVHRLPARATDEPAFVAGPRPTLEPAEALPAPARARLPAAIAAIALFGGAGVGAALLLKQRDRDERALPDAALAVAPRDAGPNPAPEVDAAVVITVGDDAGVDGLSPPRRPRPSTPRIDRPIARTVDAGVDPHPWRRDHLSVEILTRPIGGILYIDRSYRGPSGTHIEEPRGTRVTVTCTLPGYENGTVEVVFDGQTDVAICRMARRNPCVPGLKNPFDDCPD